MENNITKPITKEKFNWKEIIKSRLKNLITVKDILMIAIGFFLATVICFHVYNWRMWESTTQGSFIYDKKVYEVILRIMK